MVELVDHDHVGDLHDPGLERLDGVARAGHQYEQDQIGDPDHLDVALSRAHGLEQDHLASGRVEQQQCLECRLGETAEMAAAAHRADEHPGIEKVIREPDAVASRAPCVNGLDGSTETTPTVLPEPAHVMDERRDEWTCRHPGGPVIADR